ncbi:MAG TPA: hypothetical protein VEP89_08615, partial [Draconibacterium sp.]|nr:hypothetical protein [Draconibacterium sp.]
RGLIRPILMMILVCLSGIFIGLLFYPNFFVEKSKHIIDAWNVAKNFPVRITLIHEGKRILSTDTPSNYLFKYILLTYPIVILSGLSLFAIFLKSILKNNSIYILLFIIFIAFFPIFYIIISDANIYNGWRHITFHYPPMVILSSIGIYTLIKKVESHKYLRTSIVIILVILIAKPFIWMVENHPYSYVYFNELTGKNRGFKEFDTDYQQLGASESYNKLVEYLRSNESENIKFPVTLYTNNEAMIYQEKIPEDSLKIVIGGFSGYSIVDWDYAIFSSIYLDPKLYSYTFPPKGEILHEVDIHKYPINFLIRRENKFDRIGINYLNKKDLNNAYSYLTEAYNYDNNNYRVWVPLAYCCLSRQESQNAKLLLTNYLSLFPGDKQATTLLENTN